MISVIIPAYNAEKTLERAVESILNNQNNELEIEIIIIDDGSTDSTPEICDRLARIHNIRVFHTKNNGMVVARNTGIREAKGEFIGFVDSDDWIESDMYELLIDAIRNQDADLVACGVIHETPYGSFPDDPRTQMMQMDGKEIYRELLLQSGFRGYMWNKLYKRSLIPEDSEDNITQCEDLLFNVRYCEHVQKAIYIPKACYHYVRKERSKEYIYTDRNLSLMDAYEIIYNIYMDKVPQYAHIVELKALKTYIHYRARTKLVKETNQELLYKIYNGIKMHFSNVMRNGKISVKEKTNILLTYIFPSPVLRMKKKIIIGRHKQGVWES